MVDGLNQTGAGDSDMRVAGNDLQHARAPNTSMETHEPIRRFKEKYQGGGPMKEYMDHDKEHYMNVEKERHKHAVEHTKSHMERHHKRDHNSQYGHEDKEHHYEYGHSM